MPKAVTSWKTWLGDRVAQWHSCSPGWLQTQHPAFPPKRGGLEARRAWRWRGRSSASSCCSLVPPLLHPQGCPRPRPASLATHTQEDLTPSQGCNHHPPIV